MINLKNYHKCFIGALATLALFVLSLAVLAISLFSANRKQAGQINQLKVNTQFPYY
ncbi:MAG: hypothetical protein ABIJ43_05080 [Candidatus Beckwithbacteria bacterium]|nr:hypothetical protein [Patescibacteria group bacterium]